MSDIDLLERRVRQTLHERAAGVVATPALYDRVRRRRRRSGWLRAFRPARLAAAVAVVLAVGALAVLADVVPEADVAVIVDQPEERISFDVRLYEPDQWTTEASQTVTEARRDGVPDAMAFVPTERRVAEVGPVLSAAPRLSWHLGPRSLSLGRLAPDCGNGDLCAGQYQEVVLVDDDTGEIVLAHALPLASGGGRFSVNAEGDLTGVALTLGEPRDTIVYRFGTSPGDREVIVYPAAGSPFLGGNRDGSPLAAPGRTVVLPEGWTVMPVGTPVPPSASLGEERRVAALAEVEAQLRALVGARAATEEELNRAEDDAVRQELEQRIAGLEAQVTAAEKAARRLRQELERSD